MLTVRLNAVALRNNLSNLGLKFQENKDMKALLVKSSCQEAKTLIKDLEGKQKKFVEKQLGACKFGWVNLPEGGSLLVEANTGHAILSLDGNPINNVGEVILKEYEFPFAEMAEELGAKSSEDTVEWPYRDTEGHFTIGIGNKFDTWQDIKTAHEKGYRFSYKGSDNITDQQFKEVFDFISQFTLPGKTLEETEEKGADVFKDAIDFYFSPENTVAYTKSFLLTDVVSPIKSVVPNFSTFIPSVQKAIADITYNVGRGAFKNKWPKLQLALTYRDLEEASKQSSRDTPNKERNDLIIKTVLAAKEKFFLNTNIETRTKAKQIQFDLKSLKEVSAPSAILARFK